MIEHLSRFDTCFYAVFAQKHDGQGVEKVWSTRDVRQLQEGETEGEAEGEEELGIHVGSVSLRLQPDGPTLPSPSSPSPLHPNPKQNPLDLRVLGYAFFASTWGKGYATEANRGLLDAYAAAVAQYKSESESESNEEQGKTYYVEAAVDEDNPASEKVLCKLGFERVGWKDEGEDKVWLNGAWRGPGYWVYGMYV
jgi:RimJ/RimL family protein N-acetyltransferase